MSTTLLLRLQTKTVILENGCHIFVGARNSHGYGIMMVGGKKIAAHRISLQLQLNKVLSKDEVVRHRCDVRACVNPKHLEIGTHADNVRDRVARKRSAAGSRNGRAKLTELQVIELKEKLSNGGSTWHLSKEYGVSSKALRKIRDGLMWRE